MPARRRGVAGTRQGRCTDGSACAFATAHSILASSVGSLRDLCSQTKIKVQVKELLVVGASIEGLRGMPMALRRCVLRTRQLLQFFVGEGRERRAGALELGSHLHRLLLLDQKLLLHANHRAWPHDAKVTYRFARREGILLHKPKGNESARAAEACLAMHCNDARLTVDYVKKAEDDVGRRHRAVGEKEIHVLDARRREDACVVLALMIEAEYCRHT